ncbi:hypothetical protein V5799_025330 [Amblyomma americanum]|uniref:Uncharacterized protein n=1 Tax=Amblyomma americanum TaxID=6943 RepID=A0AAQ4E9X0_AMBAM
MAEPQGVSWAPLVRKRAVEDLTARKRPAKDNLSSAAPERIRLKDHITESLVYDYKTMAKHSLKLTDFPFNVTAEEVQELCKGAVQIQHKVSHDCSLLRSTARYESEQRAVESAESLRKATRKGTPFRVYYCSARWSQLTRSPQLLHDKLNLHGVPEELRSKEKLSTFFPKRQDGRIAMKYTSANELIKAVKDTRCWAIGVQDIRFTLAITKDPAWARFKKSRKEGRELKKGKSLNRPGSSGSQSPGKAHGKKHH